MANNPEPPRPYYVKPKSLIELLIELNQKYIKPLQPGEITTKKSDKKKVDNGG